MDEFSHLSVMLAIVIGLAITPILAGYRGSVVTRVRVVLAVRKLH